MQWMIGNGPKHMVSCYLHRILEFSWFFCSEMLNQPQNWILRELVLLWVPVVFALSSYTVLTRIMGVGSRMKLSIITDISVLQFYGYIREILMDILTQNIDGQKINQTHGNVRKNTLKNDIKSIIDTFKLFFGRN